MDPQELTPDAMRVLFGDGFPAWFPLEIALRSLMMYVFVLVALRFLGKREISELSLFEFAIVIALGSAVGDPMFYADVPILHGVTVVGVIVLAQRILQTVLQRSHYFERLVEGEPSILVSDGLINTKVLAKERITYDELFTGLRDDGVEQLGQVRRAILETSGQISTFMVPKGEERIGLTLLPYTDPEFPTITKTGEKVPAAGMFACKHSGYVQEISGVAPACPHCGGDMWIPAYKGLLE